jgi:hypothetical protein
MINGEAGAETATSTTYTLRGGFQAMEQDQTLSLTVSTSSLSLGTLSKTAVSNATTTFSVNTNSLTGYTVSISEVSGTSPATVSDGAVTAGADEVFEFGGPEKAKNYVIGEVGKIYELQGETVARKHIEIIVKQMFSRRKVVSTGDTNLSEGTITDDLQLQEENTLAKANGGSGAKAEPVVMGITEVSLSRKSFLSAASFQHTTRVLINSAVRGSEDDLVGLMENVIIGRLIPAGSGFKGSPKQRMIEEVQPKEGEEDMY